MRLILLLSMALAMTGCERSARSYELDSSSFSGGYLKLVEDKTGVTMPLGSRGLNLYYKGENLDPSLIAKIEIPKDAAENMIKQMEKIPASKWSFQNTLSKKVTWWDISNTAPRIERQFNSASSSGFVDISLREEGEHWILYVFWAAV